jgi:uncharacterized membrane protein
MAFAAVMERMAQGFEIVGVLVLTAGLLWSLVLSLRVWRRSGSGQRSYQVLREAFGGVLLLGLELLVAADLIRTIAVEPTLQNVGVLGLIVLIRTFLSFSLEIEIEGTLPWRRALAGGGTRHISNAAGKARQDDPQNP